MSAAPEDRTLEIHQREAGDVTLLDIQGSLTLGDGEELLRDHVNALLREGRNKLLLNLAEVSYVDTAGLASLLNTYTTVTHHHGSLKLLHVTRRIQGLLTVTRLTTAFEIFEDEQTAVNSFAHEA